MLFVKSKKGQTAFKERSALFSSQQRAAFILMDGRVPVVDILRALAPLGVRQQDIDALRDHGFLEALPEAAPASVDASLTLTWDSLTPSERLGQARYLRAKPLAVEVIAALGFKGLLLNLGVESAANVEELAALLPKIQAAAGEEACAELARALQN